MPRLNNLGVLSLLLLLFLCRPSASVSFLRGENALNRADAASYCATKGASLASIINQADFDAATTACSSNSCWIGLQQSQENAWGWEWDNAAPVTNFGFDYDWDSTSPPPTAGVSPWAVGQPLASNMCVTLDGGFRSSDCGPETVHYPLCSRAKWAVLLDHKSVNSGYFSSEFLSTGIENEYEPTANAFSIIGKQGDGEHFRNGGLFYFKLNWKDISSDDEGAPVIWSQSTWPIEAASNADSQANRYTPESTVWCPTGLVRAWMPHQFAFGAYLADELGDVVGVTKDDGRADTNGIPTLSNEWASSQTLSVYMDDELLLADAYTMTNFYWPGFDGTWYATLSTTSNDPLGTVSPVYTKFGSPPSYSDGYEWFLYWHTDGWYISGDINWWGGWAWCPWRDLADCGTNTWEVYIENSAQSGGAIGAIGDWQYDNDAKMEATNSFVALPTSTSTTATGANARSIEKEQDLGHDLIDSGDEAAEDSQDLEAVLGAVLAFVAVVAIGVALFYALRVKDGKAKKEEKAVVDEMIVEEDEDVPAASVEMVTDAPSTM